MLAAGLSFYAAGGTARDQPLEATQIHLARCTRSDAPRTLRLRIVESSLLDLPSAARDRRGHSNPTAGRDSCLTGVEHPLETAQLELLATIPGDRWVLVEEPGAAAEELATPATKGLIVTDAETEALAYLRRREEQLEREQWNPYAAPSIFWTTWRGGTDTALDEWRPTRSEIAEGINRFVEQHGPPPRHFARQRGSPRTDLPRVDAQGDLFTVLERRTTTRAFHESQPLSMEQLSIILGATFGCHGFVRRSDDLVTLRKSSPSGGRCIPSRCIPPRDLGRRR